MHKNQHLQVQFLSPLTNHRIDNYGIDRNLFPVEIVQAIKKTCGQDYPVIFRLCADEILGDKLMKPGITIKDAKETACRLEKAGADAFDVTGGSDDVIHIYVPSAYVLENIEGSFVKYAEQIKAVVSVPVMTGGGVETPEQAERILENNNIDMLFIGRGLIADSDWIQKLETGRRNEIRPCVKCVECGQRIVYDAEMRCSVNPLSGKEWKYLNESEIPAARLRKTVLVIGGGIAGMEDSIQVKAHTPIVEIYGDGVLTVDQLGRRIVTKADTIVSAIGRTPLYDTDFAEGLRDKGYWVLPVGDAVAARKVTDAVHEAFQAAMSI